MPFAYGMPSDDTGPDSEVMKPTFRSAAQCAGRAAEGQAGGERRTRQGPEPRRHRHGIFTSVSKVVNCLGLKHISRSTCRRKRAEASGANARAAAPLQSVRLPTLVPPQT